MAKNNDKFIVPKNYQDEYKRLTQLANRRIKSLYKHIEKTTQSSTTSRAVIKGFANKKNWANDKTPFSRSIKGYYITDADTGKQEFIQFRNQKDFERHLSRLKEYAYDSKDKWTASKHLNEVLEQRAETERQVIIRGLNTTKNQYNITLPNGQIPQEIIDDINNLTYNQLAHFWAGGDVSEDIEVMQLDSDDFIDNGSGDNFVDLVTARISAIKKYH